MNPVNILMNLSSTQVAQQKLKLYSNQPQWTYMMSNPFNTVINPNVPKINPNDASMYLMKPLPQVVLGRKWLNVATNVFQMYRINRS